MSGLTYNACNKVFQDCEEQKLHYKTEWHRYNLKRKVAGVPGVTEKLYLACKAAAIGQSSNSSETSLSYSCGLCGKAYRSSKTHAQHLKSKSHIIRASRGTNDPEVEKPIIKPLPPRASNRPPQRTQKAEDEWNRYNIQQKDKNTAICFMCDLELETALSCLLHLRQYHGLVLPVKNMEALDTPEALLNQLILKVRRDLRCLKCLKTRFRSLEAVRMHMVAKSHCKILSGFEFKDYFGHNNWMI